MSAVTVLGSTKRVNYAQRLADLSPEDRSLEVWNLFVWKLMRHLLSAPTGEAEK